MKIAMIGQKGIPAIYGGVERHVEELAVRLADRGHDVSVYTRPYFTPATAKAYRGVRLVSLPSVKTKHFDAISHTFFATLHAIRHGNDIIHYHGVGPSLLSFLPKLLRSKAKVISTFHSIDRKHKKWGFVAREILRLGEMAAVVFPHRTIAVSKTIQRYCWGVFQRQAVYIPNGVTPVRRTASARRLGQFGLVPGEYILTVSRLIPHKGIHFLIEAYKQMRTSKKLVIVGDGVFTDAYVTDLKAMAEGDDRIIFTGFQKGAALDALFANAALYVLPSENEGLPIVMLEAASYGLCILASDIPENREVIEAGRERVGFTFRNGDVAHLREQLETLLRRPKAAARTGRLARELVAAEFNWDSIVRETERLYAHAINRPQRVTVEHRGLRRAEPVAVSIA